MTSSNQLSTLPLESIRATRVRLAQALRARNPADDEVLVQLRQALAETTVTLSDAEIYLETGNTLMGRGDTVSALAEFLKAIVYSPAAADGAAEVALSLLSSTDGQTLAAGVPQQDLGKLSAAIRECPTPLVSVCLVAARILRERGDAVGAIEILLRADRGDRHDPVADIELALAWIDRGQPDKALAYLDRAGAAGKGINPLLRAWALLDCGQFADARDATLDAGPADSEAAVVRALALFCLGQADDALSLLDTVSVSRDAALAQAIIRLHKASLGGSHIDPVAVNAANEAAITAARLDPSNPDVFLILAQVQLEGCIDVDEGRRLLASAVDRTTSSRGRGVEQSRLLRLQVSARKGNSWFQYFYVEVAAALHADDQVLERAGYVDGAYTTFQQDAALDMLLADVHTRRGNIPEAAELFAKAAVSFDTSNDLTGAVAAARKAVTEEPSPEHVLSLADYVLRWSYGTDLTVDEINAELEPALQLVSAVDQEFSEEVALEAVGTRGCCWTARRSSPENRARRATGSLCRGYCSPRCSTRRKRTGRCTRRGRSIAQARSVRRCISRSAHSRATPRLSARNAARHACELLRSTRCASAHDCRKL